MGGKSKSSGGSKSSKAAATPAMAPMQQFPSAMPGQLQDIAAQLAMGYDVPHGEILAYLQQFNTPQPFAPTAAANPDNSSGKASTPDWMERAQRMSIGRGGN